MTIPTTTMMMMTTSRTLLLRKQKNRLTMNVPESVDADAGGEVVADVAEAVAVAPVASVGAEVTDGAGALSAPAAGRATVGVADLACALERPVVPHPSTSTSNDAS